MSLALKQDGQTTGKTTLRLFALTLCAFVAVPLTALGQDASAPPAPPTDLPAGLGSDLFAQTCSACHGLKVATAQRHDLDEWRATVDKMVLNGADITDDQAAQIAYYLAVNFGTGPVTAPPPVAAAPAATAAPAAPAASPADAAPATPADAPPPVPPPPAN